MTWTLTCCQRSTVRDPGATAPGLPVLHRGIGCLTRRRGRAAAGLRPVKLHGLRHAAGSLIARTADPVFVRDFLGHSKPTTTDRYLSSKLRPEEFERLDRAFAASPEPARSDETVEP
jgi:integrase